MTKGWKIGEGNQDDFAEVSEVSQFSDKERLQAHAIAVSPGWHPLPFMQSLQLTFYRLRSARDPRTIQPESSGSEWRRGKGATEEFAWPGRNQRLISGLKTSIPVAGTSLRGRLTQVWQVREVFHEKEFPIRGDRR